MPTRVGSVHGTPAIRASNDDLHFERQANFGAAELLFQNTPFDEMAADYEIGIAAIVDLANTLGASYHAASRRYVEGHRVAVAGLVLETSPCCQPNHPVWTYRTRALAFSAATQAHTPSTAT